jgi:biotin carboxylase
MLVKEKGKRKKEKGKKKKEERRKGHVSRVLILSTTTGYQLRSFDEAAERLGIDLAFATDRCHQLEDPWRDRAIAVRFHEESSALQAILAEARRAPFQGVLAVGDRPTVLAAVVAQRLGLPGNSPDAAAASGNKREMRARFAAAGIRVPWHFTIPIRGDARREARNRGLTFPCVLKPLGLSGSRGVIRANTPDEFVAGFERNRALLGRVDVRAARTGLEDVMLVEGFIPGREFAIEGVLTAGELQVFAIFEKPDPLDGPFFEETIYVTPTSLEAATEFQIATAIEEAVSAIGLWHGPIHAECRVGPDGIVVLEVAARPIGGLCSKVLRFGFGATLEELLLRHAIGEEITGWRRESAASAVMMIPIPRRGLLKRIDGEDLARTVPGVEDVQITAKFDQLLEPLPEAGSYLGFIFARAPEPAAAEAAVREAHRRLSFVIDPAIDVVAG